MDHWNDNAVVGDGHWWSNLGQWILNFEDLTLNAQYHVGDVFVTSGIPVFVKPFQWSSGNWTSEGFTKVVTDGKAGGSGNEMNVNNVNLEFGMPAPVSGGSLLFGEYGGNLNIEINSDFRNFENFDAINDLDIGGVIVSVVNGPGDNKGRLILDGICSQFAIGGQELWIDNVRSERKIDMAFLLITDDDTPYCKGDFNRDGKVNLIDLGIFAADFGRTDCYCNGNCEGDFTYDGDVDGSDLAAFALEYTRDDCPCALISAQ